MALLLQVWQADDADAWRREIARNLPGTELRIWPDVGDASEIEYAAVFALPPGVLAGVPRLQLVCSLLAGQDRLLADRTIPDVPIARTDTPAGNASIAETALLHVMRHHRRLPEYAMQQSARVWKRLPHQPRAQTRVGFLGLGLLGMAAARYVADHDFPVAGWSRSLKTADGIATYSGPAGLVEMLSSIDILVNLLPLTEETRGMLGREALGHMRKGSALVNLARGEHLPPEALFWALDEGILSSATLDTFLPEPPPPESPVWSDPRITLTPHVARPEYDMSGAVSRIADAIQSVRAGRRPDHLVDRKLGY